MSFLFVALGGALGAVARYAISLIPVKTTKYLYNKSSIKLCSLMEGNLKSKMVKIIIIVICIFLVIMLFLFFPPSMGSLPKAKAEGGISEKVSIQTDDGELAVMLLSENTNNPVLLVCGGGPGIPQYLMEYMSIWRYR